MTAPAVSRFRLFEEFSVWAVREGPQVAPRTAQRYRRYAEQFVANYGYPQRATRADVEAWRRQITLVHSSSGETSQATASTINLKLAALRAFFDFCQAKGIRQDNPVRLLAMVSVPARLPRPIERGSLEKLYEILYAAPATKEVLQDRAILEVLFGSGLRREEAGTLRLSNIRGRQTLNVIGKGNKERLTIITEPEYEAVRFWVLHIYADARSEQLRQEISADAAFDDLRKRLPEAPIFFGGDGKPLTDSVDPGHYIWKRVMYWFRKAGLDATPHQLRHSFGTYLLEGGADIRTVQELMGHEDIATTTVYTKTLESTRLRARQAHPRG